MSKSYKLRNRDNTPNDFVLYVTNPPSESFGGYGNVTQDDKIRYIRKTVNFSHLPKHLRQKKNKAKRRHESLCLRMIEKHSHIDDYDIEMPHEKNTCGALYW